MGSLALRLACLPYKASPAELLPLTLAQLLVERAIYKISSFQNIRSARLILAHRRTQRQERELFFMKFLLLRALWCVFREKHRAILPLRGHAHFENTR
jgi:hypothetical protein